MGSAGNDQLIAGLMGVPLTDAQAAAAAMDNHDPIDVSTSSISSSRTSPNRGTGSKGSDFLSMMQMVQEASDRKTCAAKREEERKDRAQGLNSRGRRGHAIVYR